MANQMKGTMVNFTGILILVKILGLIEIVRYINPNMSCISFERCIERFQKQLWGFLQLFAFKVTNLFGNLEAKHIRSKVKLLRIFLLSKLN